MNHDIWNIVIHYVIEKNQRIPAIKTICAISRTCRYINNIIRKNSLVKQLTRYKTINENLYQFLYELDHNCDKHEINQYARMHFGKLVTYIIKYNKWEYLDKLKKVCDIGNRFINGVIYNEYKIILKYVTKYNIRYVAFQFYRILSDKYSTYKKMINGFYQNLIMPFDHVGLYKLFCKKTSVELLSKYKPVKIIKYVIAKEKISLQDAIELAKIVPHEFRDHNVIRLCAFDVRNKYRKAHKEIKAIEGALEELQKIVEHDMVV